MKTPLFLRRVVGHSMEPGLKQDQLILATSWPRTRVGDVVIADVEGREVIKRVTKIAEDSLELTSDAPGHGHYAQVSPRDVRGKVLLPKLLV